MAPASSVVLEVDCPIVAPEDEFELLDVPTFYYTPESRNIINRGQQQQKSESGALEYNYEEQGQHGSSTSSSEEHQKISASCGCTENKKTIEKNVYQFAVKKHFRQHIVVHKSLVRKMGGLHAEDTEGNEVVLLSENGATTMIVTGPTANYVLENPTKFTLNHLTNVCNDGIRDFKFAPHPDMEDMDALHECLRHNFGSKLEEYNRDLGFVQTEDGEVVVVSDVSDFLSAVDCNSPNSSSTIQIIDDLALASADDKPRSLDTTVGACILQSTNKNEGAFLSLLQEPGEEEMIGKKGYNMGAIAHCEGGVLIEILVTNSGTENWPVNTELKCVSGTGFGVKSLPIHGGVKAGETVSLTLGLETQQPGESYWVFTDGCQMFGSIVSFTIA